MVPAINWQGRTLAPQALKFFQPRYTPEEGQRMDQQKRRENITKSKKQENCPQNPSYQRLLSILDLLSKYLFFNQDF